MGIQQLSELFGAEMDKASIRRAIRAPLRVQSDPASLDGDNAQPVEPNDSGPCPDAALLSGDDLVEQILQMMDAGHDNQMILATLGLDGEQVTPAVEFLRKRDDLRAVADQEK